VLAGSLLSLSELQFTGDLDILLLIIFDSLLEVEWVGFANASTFTGFAL